MPFEFATAGKIVFGAGRIREAGLAARSHREQGLRRDGPRSGAAGPLLALLGEAGVGTVPFAVDGEPTIAAVEAGRPPCARGGCDPGRRASAEEAPLTQPRPVAALAPNPGPATDYLEIVGKALRLGAAAAVPRHAHDLRHGLGGHAQRCPRFPPAHG